MRFRRSLASGLLSITIALLRVSIDHADRLLTRVIAVVYVGIFVVFFLLVCRRISQGHTGDFRHFYFASRALIDHRDLYGPMPLDMVESGLGHPANATEKAWYTTDTERYIYPPLIAFVYIPIGRLQFARAAVLLLAINCVIAATAIRLAALEYINRLGLYCTLRLVWSVALLGMLLNIDKLRGELQMLQTNALVLLMFVLGLRWLDRRPKLAGVALGVILNIKYLSLGMVPYLMIRRRWKTLGSFAVSSTIFALLPATVSGWSANLSNLKIAFGGLFHMVGAGSGTQASVDDITATFSCSITSAMARMTQTGISLQIAMAWTVLIALIVLGAVIARYHAAGFAVFKWPPSSQQVQQPFRALTALDWSGLVTAALIFSPQTNTRHLLLAMLVTIPLAALLLGGGRHIHKATLGLAGGILFLGFILQFDSRNNHGPETILWPTISGMSWCLLLAFLAVFSNGLIQTVHAASSTHE